MTDEWFRAAARTRPVKFTKIDPTVPNVARAWNYLVGGRDNFEADRAAVRQIIEIAPVVADLGLAGRAFLRRVVSYLAKDAGIRQFLDIGAGIPTAGNTHEIAQSIMPHCRIVYVDNDPVVLTHARALLRSSPEGVTSFIDADVREPGKIIESAQDTLDFNEPVALVLFNILALVLGNGEVADVIETLLGAVPPGSFLAIMHPASDMHETLIAALQVWNEISVTPGCFRDRATVTAWFDGLELVQPGIVEVPKWRPADGDPASEGVLPMYGAVGRKPALS
jgi:S-adenosyl methyltransferase